MYTFGKVASTSLVMRRLFGTFARVARSDSTLVIEAERDTGKEIIAIELVRLGARAGKPLMVVDCGAISPNLIEKHVGSGSGGRVRCQAAQHSSTSPARLGQRSARMARA